MRLLFSLLRLAVRSEARTRGTIILLLFAHVTFPVLLLAGILLLFSRFGALAGWSASEVLVCYGVTHCAFGLAELTSRGFENFALLLANGEFDRMLVRPQPTLLQTAGARLDPTRLGRLAVGLGVLAWAFARLPVGWSFVRALTLALTLLCGSVLFSALFLLVYATSRALSRLARDASRRHH